MKPFLHGKKTAEAQPLRAAHTPHPQHGSTSPATGGVIRPGPSGPHVEVVKQGDKVVRLVITCSCGERIEVDCLYPAGG